MNYTERDYLRDRLAEILDRIVVLEVEVRNLMIFTEESEEYTNLVPNKNDIDGE